MSEYLDVVDGSEEESTVDGLTAGASTLPDPARRALAVLLTSRFITRARHRQAWDALLAYESEIRERLADMFLLLVVDREYDVAFKRQDPVEDAPRVLRRDRPLHRDASLLLIHLRREHLFADTVDEPVMITRPQVADFLRPFREDGDGDEAKFERRVDTAIRAVVDLKLMTPDADAEYLFLVSPAVVPLIGAEEVMRLEQYFVRATTGSTTVDGDGSDGEIADGHGDVRDTGRDGRDTGGDGRDTGGDGRDTGGDGRDTGGDARDVVGDGSDAGDGDSSDAFAVSDRDIDDSTGEHADETGRAGA